MEASRRGLLRIGATCCVFGIGGCAEMDVSDGDTAGGGDPSTDGGDSGADDGGEESRRMPAVSFEVREREGELEFTHAAGGRLPLSETVVRGPVESSDPGDASLTAGDSFTVALTDGAAPGDTVRLVWQDPTSDSESVMMEYTITE